MSKPRIPNQRKANLEHKKRVERYAMLIQQVYDKMTTEASRIASLSDPDTGKEFSFSDYPMTKEAIKKLQSQLVSEVQAIIMSGTSEEWKESNLIQDLVARKVLTAYTGTNRFGEEYARYFQTNPDSLKAFQQRKDEGMNLSSRVWNLSEQYKSELEESITAAIAPGMPAMELAAQVKQYLKEPNKRFRRIKEKMEDGTIKWRLSNPAKAYHPGQGVYRSSARNAQRLARTEINMAYRTAEQERWKQFDFVVGYEVKTTQNGNHVEDICDRLAGKYPKDFKFTGWHPQCMCYCIPILKTEEEFWAYDPENPEKSVNEITELPSNFSEWIDDNRERIEAAEKRGKLPYFIRDNRDNVEEILNPKPKKTPLEIAAERHAARATEDVERIKTEWNTRKDTRLIEDIKTNQNNIIVPYSEDIEKISLGKELRGKTNKEKLLKYINVLETLNNGNSIAISDYDWKRFLISKDIREGLTLDLYSKSDIKHILSVFKADAETRISKLPGISKLKALYNIKTFDPIALPTEWKTHYLHITKELSSNKYSYLSITFDSSNETNLVSYGLNMIDLSRNKLAQTFGLSKLSSKTPVQFFTEFEKAVPGYSESLKSWRSKEFFDSLKYFTPLKTDLTEGCFYSRNGKFGYVHINPNHPDTQLRLQSDFFKKSILSHEYGHCMFHQYEWINDTDIKAVYDKWVRTVNKDTGKTLMDEIEVKLKSIPVSERYYGNDLYEQLGKMSDSAQAAIKEHPWVDPMGHKSGPSGYFEEYESQLNEIIAHSSENLWIGNPVFKEIAPGLYKKMRELIAKKLGVNL